MSYLLDTNVWVDFLRRKRGSERVKARLRTVPKSEIRLCSVVKAELLYGAEKSDHRLKNLAELSLLFSQYESLDFDDRSAEEYAKICADLERSGQSIANVDLMIAAIALAHGLDFVTHNTSDFERIPGLRLEDWQ